MSRKEKETFHSAPFRAHKAGADRIIWQFVASSPLLTRWPLYKQNSLCHSSLSLSVGVQVRVSISQFSMGGLSHKHTVLSLYWCLCTLRVRDV